jgi:hypothetical protein
MLPPSPAGGAGADAGVGVELGAVGGAAHPSGGHAPATRPANTLLANAPAPFAELMVSTPIWAALLAITPKAGVSSFSGAWQSLWRRL